MKKFFLPFLLILFSATFLSAQDADVLHYRFAINLNDKNDTIYGQADIKAVIKTSGAFQVDLTSPGKTGKGMKVIRVEKDDETAPYPFTQEHDKIIFPVLKRNPGDTLVFRIFYKGVPEDGLIISKNKFGDRTFFADNWPHRAHHWIPCVDRPDDKASFEFLVSAPAHYKVVSNGVMISEQLQPDGNKKTHWKEEMPLSTKVMVIGVARFATKVFSDSPSDLPVSAWLYPQDSTKGIYDYALAPEIVKFFSGYIAPFPYKKLANVQSTTIFGGMENASCIFYDENTVTGDRSSEDLIAHEVAHQWFGDMVSEKSFAHLWLSEGFATYLENLYLEKKYGRNLMIERLQNDRQQVIQLAKTSSRPVVDSMTNVMSLLNANSYQKGGWILHMLRQEVGDAVFQKIIQTYYHQYKGSNAETSDFEVVAEKVSGKELTWFFHQWLYQPGFPVVSVKIYHEKDNLVLTVTQEQKTPYQFRLTILVEGDDGRQKLLTENITKGKHLSRYKHDFTIKRVIVDPHCDLLFQNTSRK